MSWRGLTDFQGLPLGTIDNPVVTSSATNLMANAIITTIDTYATVGADWNKATTKTATIFIKNTGANGATVTVLGSVDNGTTFDMVVLADTNVATGANTVVKVSDYYTNLRIRAKSQVAGSPTTVSSKGAAVAV